MEKEKGKRGWRVAEGRREGEGNGERKEKGVG